MQLVRQPAHRELLVGTLVERQFLFESLAGLDPFSGQDGESIGSLLGAMTAALMNARNGSAGQPLYVICRTGSRGAKACQKFQQAGFDFIARIHRMRLRQMPSQGIQLCVEITRGKTPRQAIAL